MTSSASASDTTGQFQVENGEITSPNGSVFTARGINVSDLQMGDASQILADFPGINFIRLNVYSYQSPSAYAAFIQTMTSHGIVVELEDHTNSTGSDAGGATGTAFTGSQLTNELNWYSSIASAYASNPYVWLGTDNEPPSGGLSTWQQETYNAIRNTGNNNPILIELPGGGSPNQTITSYGMNPSVYTSMTNIIADAHFYGWDSNYGTNQATVDAVLTNLVQGAQTITSANGTVPVIIGEYGPSTNGSTTDANASEVVQAVQQSTATSGAVAWGYDAGVNDNLTNGSGTLTSYGQEVAQWIASASSASDPTPSANDTVVKGTTGSVTDASGPTSTGTATSPLPAATTPAPTATPTMTPSANDTVVTGTTTAITDASGNLWTIASGGQVAVNGTIDPTTANVIELAYVNGTIWQENASDLWWGKTSPTASWEPGAGTSVSPLPAASPNDTMLIAGSTAAITDAGGDLWTISTGGQVAVNGTADPTTANVIKLAYVNGTIWQENASDLWWGKTSPTGSWAPGAGTATSPLPAPVAIAGSTSAIVSQSEVSVVATSGSHMMFISGSNDIVSLSGGTNTVTDTGSGNTYILPAAGKGTVTFTSDILNTGDVLDLKTALAATNWSDAAATLPKYLTVSASPRGAVVSIAATSGGAGAVIATITGATGLNFSTLLAHSIT